MESKERQVEKLKRLLTGVLLKQDSAAFEYTLGFLRNYQGDLNPQERTEIIELVRVAFNLTEEQIVKALVGSDLRDGAGQVPTPEEVEIKGRKFMPPGLYEQYMKYTDCGEPPLLYHIYACHLTVGATVGRRVYLDMGLFKIYPPVGVMIVGPSGVKKTTAAEVAVKILHEMELTKVYSEKPTPEFLVENMKDFAQGVIYAPELAVFLGRQRYMDGAVPLITRLLDCPDSWSTGTITRRERVLRDVAISAIYCSTPDWLITGASEDIFTGGFMGRHIIVVQYDSARFVPRPKVGDPRMRERVKIALAETHSFKGPIELSPECEECYNEWYRQLRDQQKREEHELTRTYLQRKHVHAFKLAMCYHLTTCKDLLLCIKCFKLATELLDFTESFLPPLLQNLFKTQEGADQMFVLRLIRSNGGMIGHSELIRKAEYKMSAERVKRILSSLKEGGRIEEVANSRFFHVYLLKEQIA